MIAGALACTNASGQSAQPQAAPRPVVELPPVVVTANPLGSALFDLAVPITVLQGEALLIAGYSSDQNIVSDQKIPVLGDIPGFGALFSNKTRVNQKRERMFLIRPRVVAYSSAQPTVMDKAPTPGAGR